MPRREGSWSQQKRIVAVFLRWHAIFKTLIQVVLRVEAVAPCLIGERRIGDDEIKGLEVVVPVLEIGARVCSVASAPGEKTSSNQSFSLTLICCYP
jgi:hypothetical protein